MTGYKAFDENLCCRGFQFEVGKTYETGKQKNELKLCSDTVFHFCRELHKIESVSNYTISKSRVCEVIAEGDVVTDVISTEQINSEFCVKFLLMN